MFVKKSYVDEIASALEENMSILAAQPEQKAKERKDKLVACLTIASDMLDQAGLEKEAAIVTNVLRRFANEEFGKLTVDDPVCPRTSDEALKNFEENGWMFNISQDAEKKYQADSTDIPNSDEAPPEVEYADDQLEPVEPNDDVPSVDELSELFNNL